jgi:S1-C subfamily serine protease
MKRALWIVAVLCWPALLAGQSTPETLRHTILDVYRTASDSVVRVSVTVNPDRTPGQPTPLLGSGVAIDDSGSIATTFDLACGGLPAKPILESLEGPGRPPVTFEVTFGDGKTIEARLVGCDPISRLALLKVDRKTDPLPLASLDDVGPGAVTLGIGSGAHLHGVPTLGLAGALQSTRPADGTACAMMRAVSNPVLEGDAGGAVVDLEGRLVGLICGAARGGRIDGVASAGLTYVIPSDTVAWVTERLKKNGTVRRGYLGVTLEGDSMTVSRVRADSPADHAGLARGDRIVAAAFSGQNEERPLRRFDKDDGAIFRHLVILSAPNESIVIHAERGGQRLPARTVRLGKRHCPLTDPRDPKDNPETP